MGITIFYQGKLDNIEQYPAFEIRVKELVKELGGEYQSFPNTSVKSVDTSELASETNPDIVDPTDEFHESGIRGIVATMHPNHEPLSLLVSPDGRLTSLMTMIRRSRGDDDTNPDEPEYCYLKTQFGTVESHIAVIQILTAIKAEFCSNLYVNDESGFWDNRNREALIGKLNFLQTIMNQFADGFRQFPLNAEAAEDPDIVVERLKRIAGKIQEEVTVDGLPIEIEVITLEEAKLEGLDLDDSEMEEFRISDASFESIEHNDLQSPEATEFERQQELLFRPTPSEQKAIQDSIAKRMASGMSFDDALKQTLIDRGLPPPVYATQPEEELMPHPDDELAPIVELAELIQLVDPTTTELGNFQRRSSTELPSAYAELLAHDEHMTVTVEAFHQSPVSVEVLHSRIEGGFYIREILLRSTSDRVIVQYGIVRLRLDALDDEPKKAILSETIPLGRVLIEHNVLRNVELVELWEIHMGKRLATHFGCEEGTTTFGRTAMIYFRDQPALELVEIVRPIYSES